MSRAERQAADVLSEACPSRVLLDRVADKWTALIIHVLSDGRRRFSELERQIGGISQKMLTQTLRELEWDGLVERTVYPVVPPHVDYRLTPLGRSLRDPLEALCAWAERHMPEIQAARARSGPRKR